MPNILNIGIVGASVGGNTLARLLGANSRFKIKLYERAEEELSGKGAGLMLPLPLIKKIEALTHQALPHFEAKERKFYLKNNDTNKPKEFWSQNVAAGAVHWQELYEQLSQGVPCLFNKNVERIEHTASESPQLIFQDGSKGEHDIIFCADGYNSGGRKMLFPECDSEYAGYIAWRGILPMTDAANFTPGMFFYEKGHGLCYAVPGANGPELNWVIYETFTPERLQRLRQHSPPSKPLSPAERSYLTAFASKNLPDIFSKYVSETTAPFYQIIYDAVTPALFKNNVALIGDASKTLRPHLGSGASEAIRQAFAIADYLEKFPDPREGLEAWSASEIMYNEKMIGLSRILGKALVTEPPAWSRMTPDLMDKWWTTTMSGQPWYFTDDANSKKCQ